jgi:hypothetical protein
VTRQRIVIATLLLLAIVLVKSKTVRVDPISASKAASSKSSGPTMAAKKAPPAAPVGALSESAAGAMQALNGNDPEIERIYCLIQQKAQFLPTSGDVKIQVPRGKFAALYSSACPHDTYSIVELGQTTEQFRVMVDCRDATMETLMKLSESQWEIKDQESRPGEFNFAIAGPGNFLVYCPGEGFVLTRRGHFRYSHGKLENDDGCYLWRAADAENPGGAILTLPSPSEVLIGDCFAGSDQCVANVELTDPGITGMTYIDVDHISVSFEGLPAAGGRALIFSDALEDLDHRDRGHTGLIRWDSVPSLKFPITCK